MPIIDLPGAPGDVGYNRQIIEALINASWDQGLAKSAEFDAKMANLLNTTGGFLAENQKPVVGAATTAEITVAEPSVDIPTSVDTDSIIEQFDSKYAEVVTMLSDHYAAFINNYFPADYALYGDAVTWLSEAINNPDQALPQAIRDQMLEDERSRITNEAARATTQVLDDFAARGFPLPPGAAAAATVDISTKALEEVNKAARAIVVKNFEMSYEKVKFAISASLEARKEALGSAVQYIGALASAPDTASKALNLGYDAQSKLISSVSQFYSARTSATELSLKALQFNASQTQGADIKNAETDLSFTSERVKALTAEASALAQMTTSLFNNLSAGATATSSSSTSTNTEL